MIEKILKVKVKTFRYGEVISYNAAKQAAVVKIAEKTVRVSTPVILTPGGTVVLAQNDQDKSWIMVESGSKALPSQKTLLAV